MYSINANFIHKNLDISFIRYTVPVKSLTIRMITRIIIFGKHLSLLTTLKLLIGDVIRLLGQIGNLLRGDIRALAPRILDFAYRLSYIATIGLTNVIGDNY